MKIFLMKENENFYNSMKRNNVNDSNLKFYKKLYYIV